MILFRQMIVLFLLLMVGFACRKTGLLNDVSSKALSGLVIYIANPAIIVAAGINPDSVIGGMQLLYVFGISIAVYVFLILCAMLYTRICRMKGNEKGVYQCMIIFTNNSFMGFPIIAAMYGDEALLMAALFQIPFNFLIYTYGISVLSAQEQKAEGEKMAIGGVLKEVFNIGVIACILAMVLYLTRIPVPSVIEEAIDYLGNLAAPLSMMVIGDSLTRINLKSLFTDVKLLCFSAVKLLLIPAVGVLLLKACGISGILLGVCMIMIATPVASMNALMAQQYGGDYDLASKGVALTTVLSVLTIPLISLLV